MVIILLFIKFMLFVVVGWYRLGIFGWIVLFFGLVLYIYYIVYFVYVGEFMEER